MWKQLILISCGILMLRAELNEPSDEELIRTIAAISDATTTENALPESDLDRIEAILLDPVSSTTTTTENALLESDFDSIAAMVLGPVSSTTTTTTKPLLETYKLCHHNSGEEARCVYKYQCNVDGTPLNPTTTLNLNIYSNQTNSTSEEIDGCKFIETCCPVSYINLKKTSVTKPDGCGYSNLSVFGRDGSFANFGEFPWMVALMKKNISGNDFHDAYIAGGTLIDASVVLTVAHKVDEINASNLKVRAGEWDTKSTGEIFGYQERDVKKIIIHANFFKLYAHYDFALIILEKPFDLGLTAPHIGVACLEKTLPPPGTQCYSMGWGRIASTDLYFSDILQMVTLPIMDANICQRIYRNSILGRSFNLHKTLACARGVPEGACVENVGSPIVCPIPGKMNMRYSVVGMVVYGLDCGSELPGVYVKVPEVYDWVQNTLVLEGFTTTAFKKD